ncbi:MAG TPA: phytanoyl-CoA dioxygenase family protein [Verrucomicrobiae bacterium]|nr:phytanoyl-CoA dioxygenase family protein [Verrucomicrobiae bacterium]
MLANLSTDGYDIIPEFLPLEGVARLIITIGDVTSPKRGTNRAGLRNLLEIPAVAELAASAPVRAVVEHVLGPTMFQVRGIFFDKTPGANWRVGWHQDTAIPVAEQFETPGFTGWSIKEGVPHVHAPAEVLDHMLTVRVHLDDTNEANGALRVLRGSHRQGKLDQAAITEWERHNEPVLCNVPRGGALLMRPLLLHSSAPATTPHHRRVIHLEFAAGPLPEPLKWWNP